MSVAFAPNGRHVVSGGESKMIHVWNVTTGQSALPPLRGHSGHIRSVAFSPDGKLVVSASDHSTVCLWSIETGLEVTVIRGHTDRIQAITFSPDGHVLASASDDKTVRIWKSPTGEEDGDPLPDLQDSILSLCFTLDGKYLAAGSDSTYQVRLWDMRTRESSSVVISQDSGVTSLAFSSSGLRLFSAGKQRIRSWDPQTG